MSSVEILLEPFNAKEVRTWIVNDEVKRRRKR
jgi:hypothetical protein